jgi:hypothetical protein
MGLWLPMIVQNWKPIVVALAVISLVAYRTVLVHQRDSARGEVKALKAEVAELTEREHACEAAVKRQNAVVAAIRENALRDLMAAETRQANIAADAARAQVDDARRAAELKSAAVGAGCDAAVKWSIEQARDLGRW